ncbi:radical SAM protein [Fibrobacter succinogenes]|uniref:Radical SAM superfamily enzyme, MoaA/NifB/PqqE/SkfB family n=1 Tax=Fibrobacter succinogenes TaxID=833 RepID=A0A380RWZ6_FIBSU|nr:radical SAM protein [Fibrobacter succinogenes]PWJ37552.1 MoaA/NifB/PqqE/SkfB family radical SAM enzyme [Fibrobacter succinogenes subsp. elongatus]SUQ19799.1 Radical SAM superfamily enzyme, MoaA/NifB/PqqE/SkfB family [Fibrobacter succinogenes]
MRRVTLLTNPDVCNLRCPLCFLNQRAFAFGLGEMPFEVVRAAIEKYAAERDASGKRLLREVIPSTMGEPLLYSHFDELLELCRALGIPLNLTTNGTFPGKWGSEDAMELLLRSCSDIKVSYLASEQFDGWKANVEKLVRVRDRLRENAESAGDADADCAETAESRVATVSLQVTLHKKNLQKVPELVEWASAIGIDRIKWNKVVLLSVASQSLREMYALDNALLESLRNHLRSGEFSASNVKHEGSLFFKNCADQCAVGGMCESCPFADEVWVWPDGHEDHCPNPERRFGGGE